MSSQSIISKLESQPVSDTIVREVDSPQSVGQDNPAREKLFESSSHIEATKIRGMPIHSVSLLQTVKYVVDASRSGVGGWVLTPNLDILRRFKKSASFRNLVATSTLNVADGMPLVWASRIQGNSVPGRVNGTDLMVELCKAVPEPGLSVFFLGGNSGTADRTAVEMKKRFPGLEVAGTLCPDFGFESDLEALGSIIEEVAAANPDIVFVGLGSPKQDVLINMLRLRFPNIWWLGVGVSFSFISSEIPRAPDWAKGGFEWVFRLLVEPKRLAKRYLVHGLPFFATTIVACLYQRIFGKHAIQPAPTNEKNFRSSSGGSVT